MVRLAGWIRTLRLKTFFDAAKLGAVDAGTVIVAPVAPEES